MALDYPELLEQRTVFKSFNVFYILFHDCKLAETWEKGESDHAGETREEDL